MKHYIFTCILSFLSILGFAQNALSFDGQEEYLSVAHDNDYNIGSGFTVEAWIYAENWRDFIYQGSIVAKDNQGPDRGFAFRCGDSGSLSFVMSVDNTWEEAFTTQIMNTNQWHHVAAVINNGTIKLYIDSQESATHSFTGNPSHGTDLSLSIGGSTGFGGRNFDGNIDEVRIWNDVRTPTELADNMTVDLMGNEANLVAYFPMNEGTGTTTADMTANGNTAGFNNMDETNWVNGYSLPDFDISVQSVYGVDVINMIDRPIKLSVDLQNTGTQAISDIDLTITIDGQFYTTETVSNSINSNELFSYEFGLPVDLVGLTDPVIEVTASQTADANSLNNIGTLEVTTGSVSNIIISDQVLHKNGEQFNSIKMNLPNDLYKYEQILLNIDLSCPTGGCGTWDVLADLVAITESGNYELARYITPYGIACGGWTVDITDFKSVLGGPVEFQTNILVYTENGWLLDMSMDLVDNNNQNTFQRISPLWERSYQVYGDPGISYDLAPVSLTFGNNTENSHVRMTMSGHGQGNTSNAAEFYNVTHSLDVNGTSFNSHNLWKADCAGNACSNQAGSWQFPRAGWCPGQSVEPYIINTASETTAGGNINLDYVLQDYTNLLNTGYNGNDHTEPYYKIYSYFIEQSPTPFEDYQNLSADNVDGNITGNILDMATVSISNNGFSNLNDFAINIFVNNELVATENYAEMIAVGSTVNKTITLSENLAGGVANIFAEVVNSSDDNSGDNVTKTQITTGNDNYITTEHKFNVLPNPTPTGQVFMDYDEFWKGSTVTIYNTSGILVKTFEIPNNTQSFELPNPGIFWYTVRQAKEDLNIVGKIVYLK